MMDGAPGECVNHPWEGMIMATIEYRTIERHGIQWRVSVLDDDDQYAVMDFIQPNDPPEVQDAYRDAINNGSLRVVGVEVEAIGVPNVGASIWSVGYGIFPAIDGSGDATIVRIESFLRDTWMTVDGKDVTMVDSLIDDALSGVTADTIEQMRAIITATADRFA